METSRFRSVISILDPLLGRRQHVMPPASNPTALEPVSSKSLSFSINAILGLKDENKLQDSPCIERSLPLPELCVRTQSPQHSYSDTSPRSSPYSDNTSSTSDCDSEPEQVSTHSEKPMRKKRQRTTFSPIEVWELERAYRRRPYLMSEDEEELMRRLGIPARSLKYWFQNRRAKSRKQRGETFISTRKTDHLEHCHPRQRNLLPSNHAEQLHREFLTVQSNRSNQLSHTPPVTVKQHLSFQLPMFHPDQFKMRPVVQPAMLPLRRRFRRHQPY